MTEHEARFADFNLFLSSEALFGILHALHELCGEIPQTELELTEFYAKLSGLIWSGRLLAHEQQRFLAYASDTHFFPSKYSDIEGAQEVRKQAPLYIVR